MKPHSLPVSVAMAAVIGAVHAFLVLWVWAYIGLYTPLPLWLASHGVTGLSYHAALFPADFLTNMTLCVPAGYLLCKLRPGKLWLYLIAALLPYFLWQYQLVLGDIALLQNWLALLPGALQVLLPLPATALIIRRIAADAPNNSFKPNPLRCLAQMCRCSIAATHRSAGCGSA